MSLDSGPVKFPFRPIKIKKNKRKNLSNDDNFENLKANFSSLNNSIEKTRLYKSDIKQPKNS